MCDALIGHDKCAETCTAFSRSPCCLGRYSSCKKAEHVRLCNKARSISFELGFCFQAYLSWNEHEDPNMKILKSISDPLVLVFLGSLRNRGLSMILKRDTCWWNTCCFDKANIETSIRPRQDWDCRLHDAGTMDIYGLPRVAVSESQILVAKLGVMVRCQDTLVSTTRHQGMDQ